MIYEIIATLGPSSHTESTWQAMRSAGATAFRLNTSHLSLTELGQWLERIQRFIDVSGASSPIYLDLQASKWRLGEFSTFSLQEGQLITLLNEPSTATMGTLPVPHEDFFRAAPFSDGQIVLNDAKILLQVDQITGQAITARVLRGGEISARKGITFASSNYRIETFSEKDQRILEQTAGLGFIRYAISYIKDAAEMQRYRALFNSHPHLRGREGRAAYLAAKLERAGAMTEAGQVSLYADEMWVCRGDLGAEMGLAGMAAAVRQISQDARALPVPILMAGQVLEHMTRESTPTRSEVCYLYDTLAQGYRGFVLSDETAIGRDPVESCRIAAMFKDSSL